MVRKYFQIEMPEIKPTNIKPDVQRLTRGAFMLGMLAGFGAGVVIASIVCLLKLCQYI